MHVVHLAAQPTAGRWAVQSTESAHAAVTAAVGAVAAYDADGTVPCASAGCAGRAQARGREAREAEGNEEAHGKEDREEAGAREAAYCEEGS